MDAVDNSQAMNESREDFLKRTALEDKPVIAMLAGSRKAEISTMMPVLTQFAAKMHALPLDPQIGKSIVSFCPMGCKTGFYLSTMQDVEAEDVRQALAKVYKDVFPLKSASDIVGLNEIQCGNPGLYAIDSTNAAMAEYMRTLFNAEEAEKAGIGCVYEKWW